MVIDIDPDTLPLDAQFKGHQEVIVQDIKVETDNVLFKKAKYYSPSTGRTYFSKDQQVTLVSLDQLSELSVSSFILCAILLRLKSSIYFLASEPTYQLVSSPIRNQRARHFPC